MSRSERNLIAVTVVSILWLGLPLSGPTAERKTDLSVIYNPPRLSVEARGVSLERLLKEIGAKVGFNVMDYGVSDTVLTVSIQDATVEEVLEQLLRGENYAIVYGGQQKVGGEGIDRIALLSPPAYAQSAPHRGDQREMEGISQGIGVQAGLTRSITSSPTGQLTTHYSAGQVWIDDRPKDQEQAELRAEDVLRIHALSGLGGETAGTLSESLIAHVNQPLVSASGGVGGGFTGGMFTSPHPANINESLAITTQLAQQNLRALVDGLATATNSLLSSLPDKGR